MSRFAYSSSFFLRLSFILGGSAPEGRQIIAVGAQRNGSRQRSVASLWGVEQAPRKVGQFDVSSPGGRDTQCKQISLPTPTGRHTSIVVRTFVAPSGAHPFILLGSSSFMVGKHDKLIVIPAQAGIQVFEISDLCSARTTDIKVSHVFAIKRTGSQPALG